MNDNCYENAQCKTQTNGNPTFKEDTLVYINVTHTNDAIVSVLQ